jgi:glycine/D-amino acid oxidase-like deaminating enzyme
MNNVFDVIVVGAGYIGSSVAYHLCAAGLRTALFDQGSMAAGASRANYGNIQIQDLELSRSLELVRMARLRFAMLEENLTRKVGLRRIGGLLLIENENQWQMMEARLKVLRLEGIPSELVPAERLREVEPRLDVSSLLGGLYHDGEGQVDPFQLIWGYLAQARRLGLEEYYFTEVTGFNIESGRLVGITTPRGLYSTDSVVLCTGANTRQLGRLLGREWDIQYIVGQAMVTDPVEPVLHNHVSSASFFEQERIDQEGEVRVGLAISQSHHGNLLLGEAMVTASTFQRQVPSRSLPAVAACVLRYFPSFRKLRIQRSWSAPVAYTPDSCPWLGPVPGIEGLFLATAFRSTVIVTPLVGELVTQLVTRGKCDLFIDDFLPERKAVHAH